MNQPSDPFRDDLCALEAEFARHITGWELSAVVELQVPLFASYLLLDKHGPPSSEILKSQESLPVSGTLAESLLGKLYQTLSVLHDTSRSQFSRPITIPKMSKLAIELSGPDETNGLWPFMELTHGTPGETNSKCSC